MVTSPSHFQVSGWSYDDLKPNVSEVLLSPVFYSCPVWTTICWLLPDDKHPQSVHNPEPIIINGYSWVNIAVDNDPQFAGQESVLDGFNYTVVSSGSLFYCSRNNSERPCSSQPENIIEIFAEAQDILTYFEAIIETTVTEAVRESFENLTQEVKICKDNVSEAAKICEKTCPNVVTEESKMSQAVEQHANTGLTSATSILCLIVLVLQVITLCGIYSLCSCFNCCHNSICPDNNGGGGNGGEGGDERGGRGNGGEGRD